MFDTWVPYPFQNNIRYLPKQQQYECLAGLIEAQTKRDHKAATNFDEFIDAVFGDGIAKHFMKPYNFKVWAHPPKMMNKEWIGERVAVLDINRAIRTSSCRATTSAGAPTTSSNSRSWGAPASSTVASPSR